MSIRGDQIDLVASELEAAGTSSRQLSIKAAGVTEAKLGFSWNVVEIPASSFSFSATRSTYDLSPEPAASANGNVTDFATLLKNGIDSQTLVTTTAAADEFSLSGTTLSVHGDIRANGATYKLRYIVGTASGEASASGNQIWLGKLPQQPLNAKSDYFSDNILDSKWEEWDPGTAVTVEEDSGLTITAPSDGSKKFGGIIQTLPADASYAITLQLRTQYLADGGGDGLSAGVIWGEDLAVSGGSPSTGNFYICAVALTDENASAGHNFQQYSSYTTFLANYATGFAGDDAVPGPVFLRLFINTGSTQISALVSRDGRSWQQRGPAQTYSLTPGSMGIAIHNNTTSGVDAKLLSAMFRVDATSDPYLPVGGYVGTTVPSTFQETRDVTVVPNGTVNLYGWTDRKAKLIKVQPFSVVVGTVGAYTMALTKDPGGTADNMLSAATFNMTGLSAAVPGNADLTSTVDDLILDADQVWQATFTSDNAGLDAAGVYFKLTWLVL